MTELPNTSIVGDYVPLRKRLTSPKSQYEKRILQKMCDVLKLPPEVKAIALTMGKYTLVDAEDFDFLMKWEWQYRDGYAKRGARGHKAIPMHGVILRAPQGMEPDHKNGDGLDNRKNNLRPATHQQNMWNRSPVKDSSSKYKGVSFQKATNYWKAYIKINEKQKHLGCFLSEEEAAIAYNRVAKELHGEFAKLNPVEDKPCLTKLPPRW